MNSVEVHDATCPFYCRSGYPSYDVPIVKGCKQQVPLVLARFW
jgi:hypothetical protein